MFAHRVNHTSAPGWLVGWIKLARVLVRSAIRHWSGNTVLGFTTQGSHFITGKCSGRGTFGLMYNKPKPFKELMCNSIDC